MHYAPLAIEIEATSTLLLALEKLMQSASSALSCDELYEISALRLQLALARRHASRLEQVAFVRPSSAPDVSS
jgi:hypothetical protein